MMLMVSWSCSCLKNGLTEVVHPKGVLIIEAKHRCGEIIEDKMAIIQV